MSSMDTVFNCVIPYVQDGDDRNSVSLVCRKGYQIDCLTRKNVTVHMHYAPTPSRLSKRFPFLESLTLTGMKNLNTSIDLTQWIQEIAIKFPRLKSLCIRRLVIRDSDLEHLVENRGKDLWSLKICECKGFSENGLMCVAKYCSELRELCLEGNVLVGDKEVEEHGKWLRVLALRKNGIEKFSHRYDAVTTPYSQEDVVFLVEKCRESLVSLRVDSCHMDYAAAQAISNVVNLQDFYGAIFDEDEQYIGFKLPSSICSLGLSDMPQGSIQFVDHLLNQLRKLDFRWIDVPEDCQCLFLQCCPNLEVLYMEDVCKDTGLELISQVCKKLRKLAAYPGTHLGLMAVAQGCPNLEYLSVKLADVSNEALECIGSNLKNLRVFYILVQPEEDEECNTSIPLDNGIRAMLIGCTKLEKLSIHLYDEEDLTDVGLGFIGQYGINLRFLSLGYIGGSDEGLRALSMGCPRLRTLEIQGYDISEQAISSFLFKVHTLRYIYVLDDRFEVVLALTRQNFGSSTMAAQVVKRVNKSASSMASSTRGEPTSNVSLRCKEFNAAMSCESYWLSRISESEKAAMHHISLGFFKLALEAGCQNIKQLTDELKSYDCRHNLLGLGESAKHVFQSYHILKQQDMEEYQTHTVLDCVLPYIHNDDRNSISLLCRHYYDLDRMLRKCVTVHIHYSTPSRLLDRFPKLESITLKGTPRGFSGEPEIPISQWIKEIARRCSCLKTINLHRVIVTNSDLKILAKTHGKQLAALKIKLCSGFTSDGMLHIGKYCHSLKSLYLRVYGELTERDGEWFHQLAIHSTTIEKFEFHNISDLCDFKDWALLAKNCSHSLASVRISLRDLKNAYDGACYGLKLPPNIRCLGLHRCEPIVFQAARALANQLTELDFRYIIHKVECVEFVESCPNLQILYLDNVFDDDDLTRMGKVCKKLKKFKTAFHFRLDPSASHMGLIALAKSCPELECVHICLNKISNNVIRCVGRHLKKLRDFHVALDRYEVSVCGFRLYRETWSQFEIP